VSGLQTPLPRLRALADRHLQTFVVSEEIALQPLARDHDISPAEMRDMIRFRALAILRTAFAKDPADLQAAIEAMARNPDGFRI
jgi:hypothetical protein